LYFIFFIVTILCIYNGNLNFSENEEASSIAAFLVLSFLFSAVTTKRKIGKTTWKSSKTEMKDGTHITHIKSHSELQETITRRKDKFFQFGLTLQPLVIIVGKHPGLVICSKSFLSNKYCMGYSVCVSQFSVKRYWNVWYCCNPIE